MRTYTHFRKDPSPGVSAFMEVTLKGLRLFFYYYYFPFPSIYKMTVAPDEKLQQSSLKAFWSAVKLVQNRKEERKIFTLNASHTYFLKFPI